MNKVVTPKVENLGQMRDRLMALSDLAKDVANRLDDTGRPMRDYEKQIVAAAYVPAMHECFQMMIGNLVVGNPTDAKDLLDTLMSDVMTLADL